MKLVELKCPSCQASISLDDSREFGFCQYCGNKVLIHNENEHIYRHINDADIIAAKNDVVVKMRELELKEKYMEEIAKKKAFKVKISIVLGAVGILMMVLGYILGDMTGNPDSGFYMMAIVGLFPLLAPVYIMLSKNNEDDDIIGNKIKIPNTIDNYKTKNYLTVEMALTSAGFTNVKSIPLKDLKAGILKKKDFVDRITVNGTEIQSGGKKVSADAGIVITYHSFPK